MSELYPSKIVRWAQAQVGTKENPPGSNKNPYAADMDENFPDFYNTKKQGSDWCSEFCADGFCRTYGEANALKMLSFPKKNLSAGVKYAANYFKQAGKWSDNPVEGAWIFFKKSNGSLYHVGLVEHYDSKRVYTIEGNSGNAVKRHDYLRTSSKIAGYGIPSFDEEKKIMVELTQLEYGMRGEEVKTVQRILRELGYKGATGKLLGVDGIFGDNTIFAVKAFQKDRGIGQDGKVGAKTWPALLKGTHY